MNPSAIPCKPALLRPTEEAAPAGGGQRVDMAQGREWCNLRHFPTLCNYIKYSMSSFIPVSVVLMNWVGVRPPLPPTAKEL